MEQIRRVPHLLSLSLALGGMFLSSLACSAVPFLKPTATPTATSTPTFTLTPTVTLTPTATLTPTRTITPTVSYLDWPVVFSDSFDDPSSKWKTGDDENEYVKWNCSITGGKYLIRATAKQPVIQRLGPDLDSVKDFLLSVEVKKKSGPASSNFGLFFRGSATSFYLFSIATDPPQYLISMFDHEDWTYFVDWARSALLHSTGSNQLTVLAQGSHFRFFINGEEVDEVEDDTLARGTVGLAFSLYKSGDKVELELDNFELRAPKS